MRPSDVALLLSLAALWGASYLFMRMGAAEFGPFALAGARAAGATVLLLPLLAARAGLADLRAHWKSIAVVGLASAALPFLLFGYAALYISAGLSAIFNAATPLYAAAIARLWLKEGLSAPRIAGLAVGFAGVMWLVWDKASFAADPDAPATGWAVLACLAATGLYAFAANYTKRHLSNVPPLAVATGSQLASALALALPSVWLWPVATPTPRAWLSLVVLAIACTAVAYLMFFRLIANVGASRAVTVAFLIPAFGVLWGIMFLDEAFTLETALGCAVILVGTALTTGLLEPRACKEPESKRRSNDSCKATTTSKTSPAACR